MEEFVKKAKERTPRYQALPKMLQKYYVKTWSFGKYVGIYTGDSSKSLEVYRAYEIKHTPDAELAHALFSLLEI